MVYQTPEPRNPPEDLPPFVDFSATRQNFTTLSLVVSCVFKTLLYFPVFLDSISLTNGRFTFSI